MVSIDIACKVVGLVEPVWVMEEVSEDTLGLDDALKMMDRMALQKKEDLFGLDEALKMMDEMGREKEEDSMGLNEALNMMQEIAVKEGRTRSDSFLRLEKLRDDGRDGLSLMEAIELARDVESGKKAAPVLRADSLSLSEALSSLGEEEVVSAKSEKKRPSFFSNLKKK